MARKMTELNVKKMKFATELLEKKATLTRLDVHLAVKKKFKGILPKRLMDQVFKFNTSGVTSGRFSSAGKAQLANSPRTLPPIKVPKGAKVIDVGLKVAWAKQDTTGFKPITVTSTPKENDGISDGLRKLLIMVREEMLKSDVCDLHLDEDGNLELTLKQISHVNTRLPERVVTY